MTKLFLTNTLLLLRACAVLLLFIVPRTASLPDLSFFTVATGFQELGAGVTTSTSATLTTQFSPGFAYMNYTVNVFRGVKVTHVHLHCGAAGDAGPVVTLLYGINPNGINVNGGKLASGRLQKSNLLAFNKTATCGITINNIVSLYGAMRQGLIYMNVHTKGYPDGEVRGQIYP